jgi:hypothetical protein
MTGLNTGNRADKPAAREQEILTPRNIADFCRAVFGGTIVLDPCAAVDDFGDQRGFVEAGTWADGIALDGLAIQWTSGTFVNPPYADLQTWLQKAMSEAFEPHLPAIAVLCPVRSNRKWWRLARNTARRIGAYIELDPFPFVGYEKHTIIMSGKRAGQSRTSDECAPMAMCLMLFNVDRAQVCDKFNLKGEVMF